MNQRPPRDPTEILALATVILFSCSGILYMAGGLASLVTTRHWPKSAWIDASRVVFHPGDPAVAFGMTGTQFGPVTYWTALTFVVAVPIAAALLAARLWQGRRSSLASRRRALATRPGLATPAEVDLRRLLTGVPGVAAVGVSRRRAAARISDPLTRGWIGCIIVLVDRPVARETKVARGTSSGLLNAAGPQSVLPASVEGPPAEDEVRSSVPGDEADINGVKPHPNYESDPKHPTRDPEHDEPTDKHAHGNPTGDADATAEAASEHDPAGAQDTTDEEDGK